MHKHILFKFIAILLCAACLLTAVASGIGILFMAVTGLYAQSPQEVFATNLRGNLYEKAYDLGRRYTIRTRSNMTQEDQEWFLAREYMYVDMPDESLWYYRIYDMDGNLLESRYDAQAVKTAVKLSHKVVRPPFPMILDYDIMDRGPESDPTEATTEATIPGTTFPLETVPEATKPPVNYPQSGYYYKDNFYFIDDNGVQRRYLLGFYEGEDLQVELFLLPEAFEVPDHWAWNLVEFIYAYRYLMIGLLAGALLLFALLLVYLCCVAGRKPKSDEVNPAGLNRLPLDLYLAAPVLGVLALGLVILDVISWESWSPIEPLWLLYAAVGAAGYLCALLIVGFLFAFAAQVKVKGCWWLKHTAVGSAVRLVIWLLKRFFRGVGKLFGIGSAKLPGAAKTLFGKLKQLALWLYRTVKKILISVFLLVKKCIVGLWTLIGKILKAFWRWLARFMRLIPLTWQWLLASMVLVVFIAVAVAPHRITGVSLYCIGMALVIVMYGAHCFGILLESTKRMSKGDLDTKVDDRLLLGSFQEYATHLNALAGVATEAAKQQMKSERMKAELVTNVSHDIKTPLTSIINYVDLLQKAQSQEEAESYLEVLERQSSRYNHGTCRHSNS